MGHFNTERPLDPAQVHPSRCANRNELSFQGKEFLDLVEEIASAGRNVQPIKVRPLAGQPGEYEIVFGHRRHRACKLLRIPVWAVIEEMDDKSLFVEMDRENRNRADLRPYEQGVMYKKALDEGLYPSLRKMVDALGVHLGNASVAVQLANLPTEVIEAFASPLEIQFRWVKPLTDAIEVDRARVLAAALEIKKSDKRKPMDVFHALVGAGKKDGPKQTSYQAKGAAGKVSVSFKGNTVVLKGSAGEVPEDIQTKLRELAQSWADQA